MDEAWQALYMESLMLREGLLELELLWTMDARNDEERNTA